MFLGTTIASLLGYLIGSFSFSITIVFIVSKKDIRNHGSKNAGATNVSRMLGKKWGLTILFLDMQKVFLTAVIAMAINCIQSDLFNKTSVIIPCLFTLIGHCYPIYYKFKGGKAVSCFMALSLVVNPFLFVLELALFLSIAFLSKKISPASIFSAPIVVIVSFIPYIYGMTGFEINGNDAYNEIVNNGFGWLSWFNSFHTWNHNNPPYHESLLVFQICLLIGCLILIFKHRENIKRLIKKTEPNFFKTKEEKANTKKTDQ